MGTSGQLQKIVQQCDKGTCNYIRCEHGEEHHLAIIYEEEKDGHFSSFFNFVNFDFSNSQININTNNIAMGKTSRETKGFKMFRSCTIY